MRPPEPVHVIKQRRESLRILLECAARSTASQVDTQEVLFEVVQRPVETDRDERPSSLTCSLHIS